MSEQHATCFADDFLFQWVLESFKACKVMCNDVGVIFDVFASLDLCINSKKSAILMRLVGPEAEAWLVKHRFPAPEGLEAKQVLRYDRHKKRELPIKTTHVYLGIVLTYDAYEEATMQHRLRLAAVHKHRLAVCCLGLLLLLIIGATLSGRPFHHIADLRAPLHLCRGAGAALDPSSGCTGASETHTDQRMSRAALVSSPGVAGALRRAISGDFS